jgi:hypothetical protein
MIDKKIFTEIPGGKDKFHSAVLTSFCFDFHHFEFQVLKTLRAKWISNVAVMVDQKKLDEVIGSVSGGLKNISRTYSVNGVKALAAFHPKINYFIGDEELLMIFGSGNITPGGHGKNHELFTGFYADKHNVKQLPLLLEAWDYIKFLSADIKGYSRERIYKFIPENCSLLKSSRSEKHEFYELEENFHAALLYNTPQSHIFSQLMDKIANDDITNITIISPYYDEDGELIAEIAKHFANAHVRVFLPQKYGLPPVKFQPTMNVTFFEWETTNRAGQNLKSQGNYYRKLHSKVIFFEGKTENYLLIGSANATTYGLGTRSKRPVNQELCVLYRTVKVDWLKELGLSGKLKKANLSNYHRDSNLELHNDDGNQVVNSRKVNITSADLSGDNLSVFFIKPVIIENGLLFLFDEYGYQLASLNIDSSSQGEKINFKLNGEIRQKLPLYLQIMDNDQKPLSNKHLINYTDKLINTIPSQANRSIQKILYDLEANSINEFKILEYLNNLNSGSQDTNAKVIKHAVSSTGQRSEYDSAEVSYAEALEALKNNENKISFINSYHTVRIWDSINRIFRDRLLDAQDTLMEEEEEANAEASRERLRHEHQEIKVKPDIGGTLPNMAKLVGYYCTSTQKIRNMPHHNLGIIDFTQFLLTTHVLTAITFFIKYDYKDVDKEIACKKKLKDAWKNNTLTVLKNCSKLLVKHTCIDTEDENYHLQKKERLKSEVLNRTVLFGAMIKDYCTKEEIFIEDEIDLMILNAFSALGLPDVNFDKFIEDVSVYEGDFVFNPTRIITRKNYFIQLYKESIGEKYFYLPKVGYCRKIEYMGKRLKYKSVYGIQTEELSKLKKEINNSISII